MINQLQSAASRAREDIITMSYRAQSAHMGGALSCVEILVSLYWSVMRADPKHPDDPQRDRLILSKAHDAKALYAVLCGRGYFPKSVLEGYEKNNGLLPGHSTRHCVPGVEASAGGLGHGLSMAAGVAWALTNKQINNKRISNKQRVFAILSDGECDEGSTWEAALFAGHHTLQNLTVVIDYNKLQGYGKTRDILDLEPFADKWKAFGFDVTEVDGHDFSRLIPALKKQGKKPRCVIAHTKKGLGGPKQYVGQVSSQYKPPTEEEYNKLTK